MTTPDTTSVFLDIKGKKFHCELCESNMFTPVEGDLVRFICNGCNAVYRHQVEPENE